MQWCRVHFQECGKECKMIGGISLKTADVSSMFVNCVRQIRMCVVILALEFLLCIQVECGEPH